MWVNSVTVKTVTRRFCNLFVIDMYINILLNIVMIYFCLGSVNPRKGQRYTLLLDGGLIKGWGSKDSWLLIVCHDLKILSWHTKGCPPV